MEHQKPEVLTPEQKATDALRTKYAPPKQNTPLQQAQLLDKLAMKRTRLATFMFAALSVLVLLTGIACCTRWHIRLLPYAATVSCIGVAMCCLIPKIYYTIKRTEMDKIRDKILELTQQ